MKVEIDKKIIVSFLIFLIFNKIDLYLIFIISIMIHEFAHLIVGYCINGRVNFMKIGMFGISLDIAFYRRQKLISKMLFYFAGPLANLIIFKFYKGDNTLITYTNYALFLFNLLPILPLDGGRIILEILKRLFGRFNANYFMICFTKCFLFLITFLYATVIVKVQNFYILLLLMYLWRLLYIEEEKFDLYKRTIMCIKDIEINLK